MKNKYTFGQAGSQTPVSKCVVGVTTVAALLSVGVANAQSEIEEIVVTGSMIKRDGFETPTPVSVLGEEAMNQMPVTQIGELVERLPAFSGSQNSRNNVQTSEGTAGTNLLDLRGLGANRTLILLDGKRVVAASIGGDRGGAVDISNFPSGLIQRVEVNTGGASAVYGSDALAGVVNFILNKEYTGFKARAQYSETTHGDGEAYQVGFTGGLSFADGRGHFLVDVERGVDDAIVGKPRRWAKKDAYALVRNPAYAHGNGEPQYMTIRQAGLNSATRGGLIVSGPLRGTQFGPGGEPLPFDFGNFQSGVWQSGGDWRTSRVDLNTGLAMDQTRENVFTRVSFDLTDSMTVYGEVMYGRSESYGQSSYPFEMTGMTIYADNPFIPAAVKAAMDAQGITEFGMGTLNADAGQLMFHGERKLERYVLGIEGSFDAFGSSWDWEASYVNNQNEVLQAAANNTITANFYKAIDVVLDGSGNPVCRVNTDPDPSKHDLACVPLNPMGTGVLTPEAKDYAFTTGWMTQLLEQEVVSVSVAGEPFDIWAGPVSFAFGAAYRTEEVSGRASELDKQAALFAGNYNPSFGKYNVTEYYAETVVPVVRDLPFVQQLDLNGAVRRTDYSTSGNVTTWKAGLSWRMNDELRFRATQSRDIRAPNLGDLFDAGKSGTGTGYDPFLGIETQRLSQTRGNPDVKPEIGDTTGLGFVYQPSWADGLSMSVDYYNIEIRDAILTVGAQEVVDRCFAGDATLCNSVLRGDDGLISMVLTQPQNLLSQETAGYDVEASYRFPASALNAAWVGDLSLRGMVTYVDKLDSSDGNLTVDGVGVQGDAIGNPGFQLTAAKIRYLMTLSYMYGPVDVTLAARGIGSGVYSNSYVRCAPGSCPIATAERPTADFNNKIDAVKYFDLTLNYHFGNGRAFFAVQNLLDEDPPRYAMTSYWAGISNNKYYETRGRVFRVGINYEF